MKDISLSVKRGEFHVILGANGSGKSTLLKLLSKLLVPDGGTVETKGSVGIAFQNPDDQFVYSRLIDDVSFGPINNGLNQSEISIQVKDALSLTSLLDKENRDVDTLSGGEKERAALAGVLALDPDVLILDEVLSMQDEKSKREYINLLLKLKERGKTIVLVTHDSSEAAYSDYVHILKEGCLIYSGKRREALSDIKRLKSANIAPPKTVLYAQALTNRGVSFAFIPTTVEEFEEALCK